MSSKLRRERRGRPLEGLPLGGFLMQFRQFLMRGLAAAVVLSFGGALPALALPALALLGRAPFVKMAAFLSIL